jgi:hypothetical protein
MCLSVRKPRVRAVVGKRCSEDVTVRRWHELQCLTAFADDEKLRQHFAGAAAGGELRSAKVAKKKTKPGDASGKLLSAGFGFVECATEAGARELLKQLQVILFFSSFGAAAGAL